MEEMLRRGYLPSASAPLKLRDRVIGLIVFYTSEKNFFDEKTRILIEEVARELNFALDFLKKEEKLERFSLAVEQTSDWVLITDRDGVIRYANRAVEEITGYRVEEIIGRRPSLFKSGKHPEKFYRSLWETILSGRSFRSVFINRKKNGELFLPRPDDNTP